MNTLIAKTIEQRREWQVEFVQSVLYGITIGTVDVDSVLAACPPCYVQQDRKAYGIYTAIAALAAEGRKPNMMAVAEWLNASKDFKDISPLDVASYNQGTCYASEESVLHIAGVVRREGLKARAEGPLMGLVTQCQQYGNDPAEIAQGAAKIAQALEGAAPIADYSLAGIMQRVVGKLEQGVAAQPLQTPWPQLNRVLKGGLVPGELAILAARPGMGKTALAGCLAVEVARAGKPVLFISREVKDETVAARMLAREARIDSRYFRQGIADAPNILPRIREAQAELAGLPLSIVERSIQAMTPREVRRLAKSLHGVGLIVVDYLQLMQPDEKTNSREREVAEMSRSFKQLALDCDCPVLLLSQLNRSNEQAGRAPELSDLRESGAIEQDADIVMFLHTEKRFVAEVKMLVKLIVSKGRSSGTGAVWMTFDKPFADFTENQRDDVSFPPPERQPMGDNGL